MGGFVLGVRQNIELCITLSLDGDILDVKLLLRQLLLGRMDCNSLTVVGRTLVSSYEVSLEHGGRRKLRRF